MEKKIFLKNKQTKIFILLGRILIDLSFGLRFIFKYKEQPMEMIVFKNPFKSGYFKGEAIVSKHSNGVRELTTKDTVWRGKGEKEA